MSEIFNFFFNGTTAVLIIAICLIYYFSPDNRIKRGLKQIKLKSIGSINENELVKVKGRVVSSALIIAPVSGKQCVYYKVVVRHRFSHRETRHTVITREKAANFSIENNEGRVFVDMKTGYKVSSDRILEFKTNGKNRPSERLKKFLIKNDVSEKYLSVLYKTLRYEETTILPNDIITVSGRVLLSASGNEEGKLSLVGEEGKPILISA